MSLGVIRNQAVSPVTEEFMRIIEEVRTLQLQFISLFLVFISTVLIQFADFRIGEYQNSITQEILEASNLLQTFTAAEMSSNFAELKQYLPFERATQEALESAKSRMTSLFKSHLAQDPAFADLITKLQTGSISLQRYYTEAAMIQEGKSREYLNQYNTKILSIKTMLKEGTVWKSIKKYLLFPLQVAFICVLAIGYYRLMAIVSNRIAAK